MAKMPFKAFEKSKEDKKEDKAGAKKMFGKAGKTPPGKKGAKLPFFLQKGKK